MAAAPKIDPSIPANLRTPEITRTFDAPRKLVWQAWTDPSHIREWWGPHGFDAVNPSVELRVGGEMNFDMRAPDGTFLPGVGIIQELEPPKNLVVSARVPDDGSGAPLFEVLMRISLTEDKDRTKLSLRVTVVSAKAAAIDSLAGMEQGWTETLEKMSEHLDRVGWGVAGASGDTSFVMPANRPVVLVRRTFDAPRDLVWRALVEPEMRVQWWGPAKYQAKVRAFDVRPGGKWHIDHIAKDGEVFSFFGEFTEVRRPGRLVNTFNYEGLPPTVETTTLSEANGRTTLTNVGTFDSLAGRNKWVEPGMEAGARESMERLAGLLARMKIGGRAHDAHTDFAAKQKKGAPIERKVTHATFVIDRTFDAPPRLVFNAFADEKAKDRWFVGPPDWVTTEKSMDFRVGGREVNVGGPKGGPMSSFDCRYYDIVPNERIVYAYEMHLDDQRISVSVATIEFKVAGGGTRLVLTEQGAFLDGFDNPKLREEGTHQLMDALERSLKNPTA